MLAVYSPVYRALVTESNDIAVELCLVGSRAEFYITPPLTCLGDADFMENCLNDRCRSRDDLEGTWRANTATGRLLLFYSDEFICPGYVSLKLEGPCRTRYHLLFEKTIRRHGPAYCFDLTDTNEPRTTLDDVQ